MIEQTPIKLKRRTLSLKKPSTRTPPQRKPQADVNYDQATAIALHIKETYPQQPYKVGILIDLANLQLCSLDILRRAMSMIVGEPKYLRSVIEGTHRYDLDGNPVEPIKDPQRGYSKNRLKRLEKRWKKAREGQKR